MSLSSGCTLPRRAPCGALRASRAPRGVGAPAAAAPRRHAVCAAAGGKPLTLYTNPNSRSQIIEWYAKEVGLKYDTRVLNMGARRSGETARALSPSHAWLWRRAPLRADARAPGRAAAR